ncbi:hypothetical protein Goarm_002301 [Gossypium armourianum]|uniref:DUF4283 domain-containing protein n=1 Tax=Gossypium armourianum TaxID=34283 RepID=A0A7J9K880_9ROSI|nr:hypothetical protein [Gossypium armourianum]
MARLCIIDEEEEEVLQVAGVSEGQNRMYDFCLVVCFFTVNVIQFQAMRNTLANLWHPLGGIEILNMVEKQFLFQFFHLVDIETLMKGVPCTCNNHLLVFHRHSNSFCPIRLRIDVNEMELRWDISLRALPARRAVIVESVWLREGSVVGSVDDSLELHGGRFAKGFPVSEGMSDIIRVLGMNLEGRSREGFGREGSSSIGFG